MKQVKVYYMGRHVNGRYSSFKSRVRVGVELIKKGLVVMSFGAVAAILGGIMFSTSSQTVVASAPQVVTQVVTSTSTPPVLQRIAKCESGGNQFNKNGGVLLNVNTNGTVDIGLYQINSTHEADAHQLGDDVFTEEGNAAYATWLYENRGTGAWASSQKCWQ